MNYTNLYNGFRRQRLVGPSQLMDACDIWTPHASQRYALGCELDLNDGTGRKFRYLEDGGSGITKALMAAAQVPDAQQLDNLQTAYGLSVGESKFDVLVVTLSGIANHDLIDGWMLVNQGSGAGDCYLIKDNTWKTGDTVLWIEIADRGGIRTAIAATDNITFIKNKCKDVNVHPTARTAEALGVPLATVAANYFFWAQYKGPCPLQVDNGDSLVIGGPCGESTGTAGAAGHCGVGNADGTDAIWGTVLYAAAGDDCALIDLDLT